MSANLKRDLPKKSQASFVTSSKIQAENGIGMTSPVSQSNHPNSIRDEACMIALPVSVAGINKLKELLAKAEALTGTQH
jgi:hypothetical protein